MQGRPNLGYCYLHNAIDDHSRLAYVEILPDEKADTAAGFWHRAVVWFAAQGIIIDRVLTDNGSCYRSKNWAQAMLNAIKVAQEMVQVGMVDEIRAAIAANA